LPHIHRATVPRHITRGITIRAPTGKVDENERARVTESARLGDRVGAEGGWAAHVDGILRVGGAAVPQQPV